jgi:FeS assembly protein IscX
MSDEPRNPLYWEATYEIVLRLIEEYPDVDLDMIGTQQLLDMIFKLPDFADDKELANNGLLTDILREWYEETM